MKLTKKLLTLSAAAVVCTATAHADNFSDILNYITASSPELKAAVAANRATVEEMRAENNLADPEVEFSRVWGTRPEFGNKWSLDVSQSFDWPGVYKARSRAVRATENSLNFLHDSKIIETRMNARLLLIEYVNCRKNIAALEVIHDKYSNLSDIYRKALEKQEVTRLEYNKTVIEHMTIDAELAAAKGKLESLKASVEAMCGGSIPSGMLDSLTEYPEPDLSILAMKEDELRAYILERDPGVAAARASAEASGALASAARRSRLPGFSVGFAHETEGDENFNGFSLGITLPFFSQRHKTQAATLQAESIGFENDAAVSSRLAEYISARARAMAASEAIEAYRPVVTDENFELLQKALDGGQISLLDFIQEENYFLRARQSYLDAQFDYHTALAELMRYE